MKLEVGEFLSNFWYEIFIRCSKILCCICSSWIGKGTWDPVYCWTHFFFKLQCHDKGIGCEDRDNVWECLRPRESLYCISLSEPQWPCLYNVHNNSDLDCEHWRKIDGHWTLKEIEALAFVLSCPRGLGRYVQRHIWSSQPSHECSSVSIASI